MQNNSVNPKGKQHTYELEMIKGDKHPNHKQLT